MKYQYFIEGEEFELESDWDSDHLDYVAQDATQQEFESGRIDSDDEIIITIQNRHFKCRVVYEPTFEAEEI